jgi:uroporphyrin-III C-methyltransferase / precorrin-2 dehydrogenase / sirohydrochlorin ferrochelatase
MVTFPIFAEVGRIAPLVNGHGDLAVGKVRTLLIRAPRVAVAASALPDALAGVAARIDLLQRRPEDTDIKGRPLVISATGDDAEDARVSTLARGLGVPVNVPDKPELCTFALGAFVERGDVTVAICTDGAAPILATHLRGWIERELHPRLGRVASIAREYRHAAKKVPFGATRRAFWQEVLTGAPADAIQRGDEAEGRRGIDALLAGTSPEKPAGRVILVGAGPGDPDLLTLKAVRALKAADVILHDSLVGCGVLDHARREATMVDVGKRGGKPSTKQADIHALMILHAREGRTVVRLKGGDAFVFGRAAEEIAAVEAAGIVVDIVPGITAAQACAVDARLPLTYRGAVRQFSLITGASCDGEPDLDWDALARPGQAFAIYMGVGTAALIVRRLSAAGAASDTKAVIVENGGRLEQRTVATTLDDLDAAIKARGIRGPAILFVGLDWAAAGLKAPAHVEHYCQKPQRLRDGGLPALRLAPLEHFALSQ